MGGSSWSECDTCGQVDRHTDDVAAFGEVAVAAGQAGDGELPPLAVRCDRLQQGGQGRHEVVELGGSVLVGGAFDDDPDRERGVLAVAGGRVVVDLGRVLHDVARQVPYGAGWAGVGVQAGGVLGGEPVAGGAEVHVI